MNRINKISDFNITQTIKQTFRFLVINKIALRLHFNTSISIFLLNETRLLFIKN